MTEAILQLDKLVKRFDALTVLKGITAEVRRGDVVGLLGLNGSGKTTLLETALGFAVADEGAARLFGQSASALVGVMAAERSYALPGGQTKSGRSPSWTGRPSAGFAAPAFGS